MDLLASRLDTLPRHELVKLLADACIASPDLRNRADVLIHRHKPQPAWCAELVSSEDDETALASSAFGNVRKPYELRHLVVAMIREDDALAFALTCKVLCSAVMTRFSAPRYLVPSSCSWTEEQWRSKPQFKIRTLLTGAVESVARLDWALSCGLLAQDWIRQAYWPYMRIDALSVVYVAAAAQQLNVMLRAMELVQDHQNAFRDSEISTPRGLDLLREISTCSAWSRPTPRDLDLLRVVALVAGGDLQAIVDSGGRLARLTDHSVDDTGISVSHRRRLTRISASLGDLIEAQQDAYADGVDRASVDDRLSMLEVLMQPAFAFTNALRGEDEDGLKLTPLGCISAAACQDLRVVQWLEPKIFGEPAIWSLDAEHRQEYDDFHGGSPVDHVFLLNPCSAAAYCGKLDVLQWLRGRCPAWLWDVTVWLAAATTGRVEVLRFLEALADPVVSRQDHGYSAADMICDAAEHGHVAALEWFYEHDFPFSNTGADMEENICERACLGGLAALQFVRAKGCLWGPEPYDWAWDDYFFEHLIDRDVVSWARANGCPWLAMLESRPT